MLEQQKDTQNNLQIKINHRIFVQTKISTIQQLVNHFERFKKQEKQQQKEQPFILFFKKLFDIMQRKEDHNQMKENEDQNQMKENEHSTQRNKQQIKENQNQININQHSTKRSEHDFIESNLPMTLEYNRFLRLSQLKIESFVDNIEFLSFMDTPTLSILSINHNNFHITKSFIKSRLSRLFVLDISNNKCQELNTLQRCQFIRFMTITIEQYPNDRQINNGNNQQMIYGNNQQLMIHPNNEQLVNPNNEQLMIHPNNEQLVNPNNNKQMINQDLSFIAKIKLSKGSFFFIHDKNRIQQKKKRKTLLRKQIHFKFFQ